MTPRPSGVNSRLFAVDDKSLGTRDLDAQFIAMHVVSLGVVRLIQRPNVTTVRAGKGRPWRGMYSVI